MKIFITAAILGAVAACSSGTTASVPTLPPSTSTTAVSSTASPTPTHTKMPVPVQATPTSVRTHATRAAPPPTHTKASCYPLTNSGNCYEPGEFCRKTDHGASGVAGDGKPITCVSSGSRWRWEANLEDPTKR